jgi:hypothetical protein
MDMMIGYQRMFPELRPQLVPAPEELTMRYHLTLRTELDLAHDLELDRDDLVCNLMAESGASMIAGGYDKSKGEWRYFFSLPVQSPFAFLLELAATWKEEKEWVEARVSMTIQFVNSQSEVKEGYVLAVNLDLCRFDYDQT